MTCPRKRQVGRCGVFLALVVVVTAGVCVAQPVQTCIPPARGVAYSSGPPRWFESPPAPEAEAIYDRIDDPRWNMSSSITHGGTGTIEEVQFRALHHTEAGRQYLYLSWWTKVSPGDNATNHLLYVGLHPGGWAAGGPDDNPLLLRVQVKNLSVVNGSQPTDREVKLFDVDNVTGLVGAELQISSPHWTEEIHVWTDASAGEWAAHARIPVDLDLGGGTKLPPDQDFKMWYELLQEVPGAGAVVEVTWPRGPAFFLTGQLDSEVLPNPPAGVWPDFHLSTGSADPGCTAGGITIGVLDIGTEHPDGAGYIDKDNSNTFYARPWNRGSAPVDVDAIRATFRLANWGAQGNVFDIVNPGVELWKEVPGLIDLKQSGGGQIPPGGQWNITRTNWPEAGNAVEENELAKFNGVERSDHQCMLVELFGNNVEFLNSSVYRNMNFVSASHYEEDVQVNVRGMTPAGETPPEREVLLHVQTLNMPTEETKRSPENTEVENGYWQEPEGAERSRVEQIAGKLPTYIVRGYYDTGRTFKRSAETRRIFRPMTSFGYFVQHDGELLGWDHVLSGAEQISPNLYRLRTDGVTTVRVAIEALEPFDWKEWSWLIILVLLILLVLALIRRRVA